VIDALVLAVGDIQVGASHRRNVILFWSKQMEKRFIKCLGDRNNRPQETSLNFSKKRDQIVPEGNQMVLNEIRNICI